MPDKLTPSSDYAAWLGEVKSRIQSARISAAHSVNRDLILLYWDIGRGIVEKQEELGWGESVVEQLSGDIRRAFPETKGFSPRNLRNMKRLFSTYAIAAIWQQAVAKLPATGLPASNRQQAVAKSGESEVVEKLQQLVAEVPWGHNLLILNKLSEPKERLYYLYATVQCGWTRSVLLNQIKADAYERSLAEGKAHNFPIALPEHLAEQVEETQKSSYNLEFLGIGREIKERELEDRLIEQLKDFILELGYGFCFIGRQHRVAVGKREYFIDLLFYHRFLKCLVAIELKIGEFKPEFAGKMDFYLNVLNEKERATDDNPCIGIILCILIDYDDPTRNVFEVTEEWAFHNCNYGTREDVVFLINGMPVLVIECKNANKDEAIALGVDQIRRYHRETPELFVPEQLFTATDSIGFSYGVTWNTVRQNIFNWKDPDVGQLEAKEKSFCAIPQVLAFLKEYIIFAEKDEELNKYDYGY